MEKNDNLFAKHIHTAWMKNEMTGDDIARITAGGNIKEFEEWMEKELRRQVVLQLMDKVGVRMETEAGGGRTYEAHLCWYDERAAFKEAGEIIRKQREQENENAK